ncbi:MAG: hypothetical protein FWB72_02290 [Firmicutes bacterium]|nr:hypothetical protein [Bacillota bacterium]
MEKEYMANIDGGSGFMNFMSGNGGKAVLAGLMLLPLAGASFGGTAPGMEKVTDKGDALQRFEGLSAGQQAQVRELTNPVSGDVTGWAFPTEGTPGTRGAFWKEIPRRRGGGE